VNVLAYITSITNRDNTSKYNVSDTNRVDNNTNYLADFLLSELAIPTTLPYTYATQVNTNWGRFSLINGLEENINEVLTNLGVTPLGWITLLEAWASGDYTFIFTNANNLEQDLDLLKDTSEKMVASVRYCGTYSCGDEWGNLFSSTNIM
jgi:hypothetical protein